MVLAAARSAERTERNFRPLKFFRGIGVRQIRLDLRINSVSYLLSHYLNHALGNISLDAMEYGLWFHITFLAKLDWNAALSTRRSPSTARSDCGRYQRRYFRWKTAEVTQLALGLSVPALLCTHLIGERLGVTLYGLQRGYAQAIYALWIARPDFGAHADRRGCRRLDSWLHRYLFLAALATVLSAHGASPARGGRAVAVLALLGFYQQGKTVELWRLSRRGAPQIESPARIGTVDERANLERLRDDFVLVYAGAIGASSWLVVFAWSTSGGAA